MKTNPNVCLPKYSLLNNIRLVFWNSIVHTSIHLSSISTLLMMFGITFLLMFAKRRHRVECFRSQSLKMPKSFDELTESEFKPM